MSVRSSRQGELPAIECERANLAPEAAYSLTEVACKYLYGSPLTPGTNGTLREQRQALIDTNMTKWRDGNGPSWLLPHLELMLASREWEFAPDISSDSREITNNRLVAAQKWLSRSGLSTNEAYAEARHADAVIKQNEATVAEKSERFYEILTQLIASEAVRLRGVPYRGDEVLSSASSRTLDEKVPSEFFLDNVLHDLDENILEIWRFDTDKEMMDRIFERLSRAEDAQLVEYRSVKLSAADFVTLMQALNSSFETETVSCKSLNEKLAAAEVRIPNWVRGPAMKLVHRAFEEVFPEGDWDKMEVGSRNSLIVDCMKANGSKRTGDPRKTIDRYLAKRRENQSD